ncbi:MAG: fibronectin type III domain-containing protein, partial [Deltaproteobacteria bacterium]|nr:fibronectin type III domain-containing protein [Deltaproteobacteria bacterium]
TWWGKFHPSALAAPTNLTATALSSSQVQLSWTNQSTGTGIRIERKDGPVVDFAQIDQVGSTVTSYTDNSVTAGATYRYRLLSFDASGGSYSAEAQVQVSAASSGGGGGGGCAVASGRRSGNIPSEAGAVFQILVPLLVLVLRKWMRTGPG